MQLSRKENACLLSVWDLGVFLPQISTKRYQTARARMKPKLILNGDVTRGDLANKVDQFGINKAESKPHDLGLAPGRTDTCTRLGSDSHGLTYLEGRGTRRAAGQVGVWTHSRAVAGRTRRRRGRCCRREVCPEGEVCCPPSPQIERV